MKLHPMSRFDPSKPCFVHDRVEGLTIAWSPDWAPAYSLFAREEAGGVVDFDGLALDGWTEPARVVLPAECMLPDD